MNQDALAKEDTTDSHGAYWQIFPTCAAMLTHDRFFILCIYPLLILTGLMSIDLPTSSNWAYLVAMLCDRLLQLLFSFLVARRWLARLSQGPRRISLAATVRFFGFGMSIWVLFSFPLMWLISENSTLITSSAFCIIGIAAWLALRFFFYPVPMLLCRGSLKDALRLTSQIPKNDSLLPLRLLVAPVGFLSLAIAVVASFSPDGREAWTSYGVSAVSGIFWLLATYLAIAASLLRLDERVWREEHLDPYRTARLSTLEFQGASWLARQLSPSHGLGWFVVSLVVWAGTLLRLFSLPPSASISVQHIAIQGSTITLSLHLSDEQHRFRGMQPIYFALGGERRAIIAPSPVSAVVAATGENAILSLPGDKSEVDITLSFNASRSGVELKALTDLNLWYRAVKISPLNMQQAVLAEP